MIYILKKDLVNVNESLVKKVFCGKECGAGYLLMFLLSRGWTGFSSQALGPREIPRNRVVARGRRMDYSKNMHITSLLIETASLTRSASGFLASIHCN